MIATGSRAVLRIMFIAVVVAPALVSSEPAAGAASPCDLVDRTDASRSFGAASPAEERDGARGSECVIEFSGGLALTAHEEATGDTGFTSYRAGYSASHREDLDDYVDGAFFGWGEGALTIVARRGDRVVTLDLAGADPSRDFDGSNPLGGTADDRPSGSEAGSALWMLMTSVFASDSDVEQATIDELDGLWRTADITPCAPRTDVAVRIIDLTATGDTIRGTKLSGDTCLDDNELDFEGAVSGRIGTGALFGEVAGSDAATAVDYEFEIVSATVIELTGQAGQLRYARTYTRLSWPGLASGESEGSALLGIPTPSEAITAKNVFLATVLALVLFAIVIFPSMLFNSTLEANLDRYRQAVDKVRSRWSRERSGAWRSEWRGVAAYVGIASVLYSAMQPGWGFNWATSVTTAGFVGALAISSSVAVLAQRAYLAIRYQQGAGHPRVEFSTLLIAGVCVGASLLAGFVPGYLYGVLATYESVRKPDDFDRARIALFASCVTLTLALVSWLLLPTLLDVADGATDTVRAIPAAIAGGVFTTSVELLTIALIPMTFLPGAALRRHSRRAWLSLWASGGFLFSLVLLRPGLVSGESRNVVATLALAAVFGAIALGFWSWSRRQAGLHVTAEAPSTPPLPSAADERVRDAAPDGDAGQVVESS
jgi:hypothetical protein